MKALESVAIDVDQEQLAEQLLAQAKEQGVELVGPRRPAQSVDQEYTRDRAGRGDGRAPGLRQTRSDRPREREFSQTAAGLT